MGVLTQCNELLLLEKGFTNHQKQCKIACENEVYGAPSMFSAETTAENMEEVEELARAFQRLQEYQARQGREADLPNIDLNLPKFAALARASCAKLFGMAQQQLEGFKREGNAGGILVLEEQVWDGRPKGQTTRLQNGDQMGYSRAGAKMGISLQLIDAILPL